MERVLNNRRCYHFRFFLLFCFIIVLNRLTAQSLGRDSVTHVSVETDPAFWWGTLPNGLGFDANINLKLKKLPQLRLGLLFYSGKWDGAFAKALLLTDDFKIGNWQTTWSGAGMEAQYQFRLGLSRGGLQPGLRLQWNRFTYGSDGDLKATANHFAVTPQLGFQWFPFKSCGFYVLPWAGLQIPLVGTSVLSFPDIQRQTRKDLMVVTAHLGWEFDLK